MKVKFIKLSVFKSALNLIFSLVFVCNSELTLISLKTVELNIINLDTDINPRKISQYLCFNISFKY